MSFSNLPNKEYLFSFGPLDQIQGVNSMLRDGASFWKKSFHIPID